MSSPFDKVVVKYLKPTRRLILLAGDLGMIPVTKIGGAPWWPQGVQRPKCGWGHNMSFVCQILLKDVPGLNPDDPGMLSFHYCQQCMYEGTASDGWVNSEQGNDRDPAEQDSYDLRIFENWSRCPPDALGVVAEDFMGP